LNAALKRIVQYKRNENGQLISDGTLAVYKKNSQGAERETGERGTGEPGERNTQGAEGEAQSVQNLNQGAEGKGVEQQSTLLFYAILDRTPRLADEDTLVLNVPIRVFITGDLAFYATVVGKEGMDKAHCHWCKLPSAQWQTYGHAPGPKWTL
jgi:hypothetical protein